MNAIEILRNIEVKDPEFEYQTMVIRSANETFVDKAMDHIGWRKIHSILNKEISICIFRRKHLR